MTNPYVDSFLENPFLHSAGVPRWFLPFLAKFNKNKKLAMVGPLLSSEISSHLQSHTISLRPISEHFFGNVSQLLLKTCDMPKHEAILEGEVGLSRSTLQQGLSIASFFPDTNNITVWDDMCMCLGSWVNSHLPACYDVKEENPASELSNTTPLESLGKTKNPTFWFRGPASHVVFAKYGGEVLRLGLLPQQLHDDILIYTRTVLANDTWEPL